MGDGLLKWANRHTRGHDHITPVNDFEESWADGLAFCALFHAYFPEKIPIKSLKADTDADKLKNLALAFKVGQDAAGIDPLLDPEDTMKVHEKKSIMLYISEVYASLKDLPVKFSASAEWNKKFEAEEKARKFAEWKAKKEAEAKGEIYTPQKAGRTGSVAGKWNPDGAKDEEDSTPAPVATSTPAATPTTRSNVSARWNSKGAEEKETAKPAEAKPTVSASSGAAPAAGGGGGGGSGGEGLTYEISGRSKDGGTEGSMLIFTVTLKLDGKSLPNPKKEDLVVYVDCPGAVPRFNIMGGSGGAYHIGLTPSFGGQYWFDFVWRGKWCNEPFCLPIKNKFNKLVDHPYTGPERAAAGQKVGGGGGGGGSSAASAPSAATRVTSGTPAKPKVKEPSPEHSLCSGRVAEMSDDDLGSFTITAKDDTDQLLKGDFTFDVKISGPSPVDTKLTNNQDGTYTCSFGPISVPGNYVILVTTGGKEIQKGKWDLKIQDAMADLEFEDVTILFQATDSSGNPKSVGGDNFEIVATGDEQPEIIDMEDGRYTLDYHVIPGLNSINVLFNGESLSGFPVTFEV